MKTSAFPAATALIAGTLFIAAPALAHPRLLFASPGVSATAKSPPRIVLRFSESLVLRFSGLALNDAFGRPVALQPLQLSADHKQIAAVPAKRMMQGVYSLHWHAVSTDTHRVEGSYRFTIR